MQTAGEFGMRIGGGFVVRTPGGFTGVLPIELVLKVSGYYPFAQPFDAVLIIGNKVLSTAQREHSVIATLGWQIVLS